MAKYIIDLNPDCVDGEFLKIPIRVAGENLWIKTKASLTLYTEPDEDEIRQMAHEEAWDFMYELFFKEYSELNDIFGTQSRTEIMSSMTYAEAKTIYDKWKKEKEEVRVGDEVVYHGNKYVVGYVGADEVYHIVDRNWIRVVVQGDYQIFKTGRHFPEVAELLKKIGEETE